MTSAQGQQARAQRKSDQAKKALDRFILRDEEGWPIAYKGRRAMHWYHAWCKNWCIANDQPRHKRIKNRRNQPIYF